MANKYDGSFALKWCDFTVAISFCFPFPYPFNACELKWISSSKKIKQNSLVLVQCSCRPLCLIGSSIHCNCHPLKKWMISKTWVRFLAFCRLYESSFNNEFNCVQSLLTAWFPATKWVLHKVSHWLCVWMRHLACPYTLLWVRLWIFLWVRQGGPCGLHARPLRALVV